jgi:hypothetical protein
MSIDLSPDLHMGQLRVEDSLAYPPGGSVGKSCAQVGRGHEDMIVATDTDVFDKYTQALHSVEDLLQEAAYAVQTGGHEAVATIVLPILVVPDGSLWEVLFDVDGSQLGCPKRTDRCSFFVERGYNLGDAAASTYHLMGNIEFVTTTGLNSLVREVLHDMTADESSRKWFRRSP